MTLSSQLSLGFAPFACQSCGTYFWFRPARARAQLSSSKNLWCRFCQEEKGWKVPWPAARRLTEEEQTELEMETARNALAYAYDQHHSLPTPLPPPPIMEKPLSLKELREKLQYQLDVTRTTKKAFHQAAGISAPSLYKFLKGGKVRNATRFKIEGEMQKRDWLLDEPKAEPVQKPATIVQTVEVKAEPHASPLGKPEALSSADMYRVIWGVIQSFHAQNLSSEEAFKVLDRLFPDLR